MSRPRDYLSQGLNRFDFLIFSGIFIFPGQNLGKYINLEKIKKQQKDHKNQGPGTEYPNPVIISLKALMFVFFLFFHFLLFFQYFLDAVLEFWHIELQFCSPAKSILQPRPAALELLLEMPCLPVFWQPCQDSREACNVETLANEALKSCSSLSVQLLPSGLQF